jgi:hypothetical protein
MGARELARQPTTAGWCPRTLARWVDPPSIHVRVCNVKDNTRHKRTISAGTHGAHDGHDAVCDTGTRRDAERLRQRFAAFALTQPEDLRMGLAVSRSISKAHGRRLWTTRTSPQDAIVSCTLLTDSERES